MALVLSHQISFGAFGECGRCCCVCVAVIVVVHLVYQLYLVRCARLGPCTATRASRNEFIVYFCHCNHSLPIKLPVLACRAAVKVKVLVKMRVRDTGCAAQAGEASPCGSGLCWASPHHNQNTNERETTERMDGEEGAEQTKKRTFNLLESFVI